MRKKQIIAGIAALVGLVAVGLGIFGYVAFGSFKPIPDGAKLGKATIVTAEGGFVSMYLLDAGDGKFVLVDGGTDASGERVRSVLKEQGATADDLLAVVLTHGHSDHIAAAYAFREVPLYAHAADVPLVEGAKAPEGAATSLGGANESGLKVNHAMEDGEVLEFGELAIEVLHTPGHTAGNVTLWVDDVMLFGDTAIVTKNDRLQPPPAFFSDDPEQAIASIRALADRVEKREKHPETLVGSHSGPTDRVEALFEFPED